MTPMDHFKGIPDPRVERTKDHLLEDIIFITVAAVICGSDTWNDMESYGTANESWLREYLQLPNGIPSHDTFNRVFCMIDSTEMERCFLNWVKEVVELTQGEVISIDGKTVRGAKKNGSKSLVHMVSAWANTNGLVLAQVKTHEKSNEITAIPKLLDTLLLKGCVVTIDAMGCQKEIAKKIKDGEADYILAVKGNQPELHQAVQDTVLLEKPTDRWTETDIGHGRIENRICTVYDHLSHLHRPKQWKGLQTLIHIRATREHKANGKKQTENRYYISSLAPNAEPIGRAVRSHWGIENSLHWVLDVAFNEDASRKREGNSAENYSIILRVALNLIKSEKSRKRSIKGKRLDAAWDKDYLLKILKN